MCLSSPILLRVQGPTAPPQKQPDVLLVISPFSVYCLVFAAFLLLSSLFHCYQEAKGLC